MGKLKIESPSNAIEAVILATGCSKIRAKTYLQRNQDDIDKAIELYQLHHPNNKTATRVASKVDTRASTARPPATVPFKNGDSSTVPSNTFTIPAAFSPKTPPVTDMEHHGRSSQTFNTPEASRSDLGEYDEGSTSPMTMPKLDSSATCDFRLPILTPPVTLQPGGIDGSLDFSIKDLVAAVQQGAPPDQVKTYLQHFSSYDTQKVQRMINEEIEGYPAIFYVVATNNATVIRIFKEFGGDVDATYGTPPIPLIAFAVINGKTIGCDTTDSVATLLSLGAHTSRIPKTFYSSFNEDLPSDGPSEEELEKAGLSEQTLWCKPLRIRKLLTETLNLTQRYYLHRSSTLAKPTDRQKWVAARHDSIDLFAIPYFLIGQSAGTELLTQHFLHHMLRRHQQPLALVFAGPSGHGKTELARRLGALLSLELHVSDCTIVSREIELFGPRKPYVGAEEGSPLNNFLAANNGQKCIVFLDEFEKTTSDIWNALLIPFDKGEYQDRRNMRTIDCSKTIWIMATNALDKRIISFCGHNKAIFDEDSTSAREDLLEQLTFAMKEKFMTVFKPPLTGRISAFVPFLPFSPAETCVGAHKYLLELMNEARRPVVTTPGPQEQLLGNIRLHIRGDASVCNVLTKDYDPSLGIRSLKKAVRDKVAAPLDFEYMATHEIISEGLPTEDYSVFVSNGKIKVKKITPF